MENALRSFIHEIYAFLQTVTIFNKYSYIYHRKRIMAETGYTEEQVSPDKNPYIVNMFGENYEHPIPEYSDPIITIVSHDEPGVNITLCRSELEKHPITLSNYRNTPKLREALFARFPERAHFIKACLFPIEQSSILKNNGLDLVNDIDFKLVGHGAECTLPKRERSDMVNALQQFLVRFDANNNIENYVNHEKYGPCVFEAMLWSILPAIMLRQRISNVNTAKAHKDLIWLYLTSNGLDDYRDILSDEQELFLYKNLRYLNAIRGSRFSIQAILKNLLKPAGLSLVAKQLMLTDESLLNTCMGTPVIVNQDLNSEEQFLTGKDFSIESFSEFYKREVFNGLEPIDEQNELQDQINLLSLSNSTRLPTKSIELIHARYNIREPAAYIEFAIETLLYWLSLKDSFGEPILNINVPVITSTSFITVTLPIRQALALLFYCELQQRSPTITITADNVEHYVGKIVLIDGEYVTLTESNIESYTNQELKLVGPINLPSTVVLNKPFIPGAKITNRYFKHRGNKYDITEIITGTERNRVVNSTYNTVAKLTTLMDQEFLIRVNDIVLMEDTQDSLVREAYWHCYKQTVYHGNCTLDWDGLNNLTEWVTSDPNVSMLLENANISTEREAAYEILCEDIVSSILDANISKFLDIKNTSALRMNIMSKLLKQLSTYDVAYLNTASELVATTHAEDIYVDSAAPIEYSTSTTEVEVDRVTQKSELDILDTPRWDVNDNFTTNINCVSEDEHIPTNIESVGCGFYQEDGEIVNDPIHQLDLTPNIDGSNNNLNYTFSGELLNVRHVEPTITTVVPPEPDPYPINASEPPEEEVEVGLYEYDIPIDGTVLDALSADGASVSINLAGGHVDELTLDSIEGKMYVETLMLVTADPVCMSGVYFTKP